MLAAELSKEDVHSVDIAEGRATLALEQQHEDLCDVRRPQHEHAVVYQHSARGAHAVVQTVCICGPFACVQTRNA